MCALPWPARNTSDRPVTTPVVGRRDMVAFSEACGILPEPVLIQDHSVPCASLSSLSS